MSLENVRIFAVPLEKIAGFFTEFIEKTERKYKKQVPRKIIDRERQFQDSELGIRIIQRRV